MVITSKQRGLTLVEVLITILVIAIGVLALTRLQRNLWHHNSLLTQRDMALFLAQKKIEELRGYETINTAVGKFAYQDIVTGTETTIVSNTSYTISWNITDNVNPFYKTVAVATNWSDNRGGSHTINLTSIINRMDPIVAGNVFL